jgi:hypothetical protein
VGLLSNSHFPIVCDVKKCNLFNVDTKQKEKRHFEDEDASETTTSGEMEQKKVWKEPEVNKEAKNLRRSGE